MSVDKTLTDNRWMNVGPNMQEKVMATQGVPRAVPMGSCCTDLEGLPPALGLVYLTVGAGGEKGGPCSTSATSAAQCPIMPIALSL